MGRYTYIKSSGCLFVRDSLQSISRSTDRANTSTDLSQFFVRVFLQGRAPSFCLLSRKFSLSSLVTMHRYQFSRFLVAFILTLLLMSFCLRGSSLMRQWKLLSPRKVTGAVMLARRPTRKDTGIPRIFHQSWSSTKLPPKFQRWSQTCREKHKDWEWVLWTDEDNLQLVQLYFPWLEAAYRQLPGEIYRADLARNLYMYIFGG